MFLMQFAVRLHMQLCPEQQHLHAQPWCTCTVRQQAAPSTNTCKQCQDTDRHAAVYSCMVTLTLTCPKLSGCTAGDANQQANGAGVSQQPDGAGPSQQADGADANQQADGADATQQGGPGWEEGLMNTLAPAEVLAKAASPRYPPQQLHFLQMLAAKDPAILASFGATPQVSPHTGSPQHHHQDFVPT